MVTVVRVLVLVTVCFLATASGAADKAAIQKNVDEMVTAINNGKEAATYPADAYSPYAFIMEPNGKLIVHPYLAGEFLQEKAAPVYSALQQATTKGVWVSYFWKGTEKETYVRKTNNNLTVGSGQ